MENSTASSEKLDKIREKALTSLFFFSKEILGYREMTPSPHREVCAFIENNKNPKKLILLPRGAFKSTIATISYPLWSLLKNPDERILISSETYAQSKTFLRAIKTQIEENSVFKAVFGEKKPKNSDFSWRQEEITLTGRKRVAREASLSVSGVGQTKVGLHYDKIILDDVVSNNNINTPEQIQKTIDHYRLLLSILEPGGELIIIGTRYSFADLYGHLLEEEAENFNVMIRSAVNKDGSLYFPTRLTKEFLKTQRKSQGAAIFANQYLNTPVDQESAIFKQEWIRFYKRAPEALNHFLLIDPASTTEKHSDFTAIIICGVDCASNIYVLESIITKQTIGDIVNIVFDMVQEYNIQKEGCVGLEVNANQQTYQYIFNQEMLKRGFFFPIKELKPNSTKSKANRIRALQPYFENGKIFLKESQSELLHQITMYPRTRHDDGIDALANILTVMTPANVVPEDPWEKSELSENEKRIWQQKEEFQRRSVLRKRRARYF